ncbi:hypothetical protein BRADI_2g14357v3 [Brachypodium distachyon]|uniref:Uncharacterized protein n=1 Tax=Brachypodium distachyon TaxID=15368 RepID=A0A2K2D8L4_BRADI|nr:hypothetical protein BRADI_2g14357v3 [Brachypodium distachyon]
MENGEGTPQRVANPEAFNNYLRWYLENTRAEICRPAYNHEILEDDNLFDEASNAEYNRLVKDGRQTSYANVLHFVRDEIRKDADRTEIVLDETPHGKKGKSTLRKFMKWQGNRLRRLANLNRRLP